MRALLILTLCSALGCTTALHRTAVYSETSLRAGSDAWSRHVDNVALRCTNTARHSEAAWDACVADTVKADDAIGVGLTYAVIALRAYWAAASAEDRAGMVQALVGLANSVKDLPPEQFGAAQKILKAIGKLH